MYELRATIGKRFAVRSTKFRTVLLDNADISSVTMAIPNVLF